MALSNAELQPIYDLVPFIQQKIQQHRHHFEYSTRTLLVSVENYRELIKLAHNCIMASKLVSVLQLRIAIRLNSFNLQK